MLRHVLATLLIASGATAAEAQVENCRAIADSARRLACYDARDAAPAASSAAPAPSSAAPPASPIAAAQPAPVQTSVPASQSSASIVRGRPDGRIASVTALRYGLSRIQLEDGRTFETATDTAVPPPAGTEVRLRRTLLGTTFLDADGRRPLTVRLVRQP
ncbi:hypothetical protein [Sphingomonas sp.]|uniref:hypothetical protein n=1 Tax=Sphingomonas sp. TaxID=28214 RepID=UPI000DAFEDF3|nr:hypothetical protein [Sphingomonas sp.]PZU08769.1 MAG: hypothetical protein DI605_12640 [Sphingomonas sp.]